MILDNIITFSEASEIWDLSKSTLNKIVGKKLIENVDCKKSGSTWLVTKEAMIREYGMPNETINIKKDEMFLDKDDFKEGNGYRRIYEALEYAKGKEIQMSWLTKDDELETFTLIDFKMFNDIVNYSILLRLKNKYSEYVRIIPNIVLFRNFEHEKSDEMLWRFECCNENILASIQKYAKDRKKERIYYLFESEIKDGLEKENKEVVRYIENNMNTIRDIILPNNTK